MPTFVARAVDAVPDRAILSMRLAGHRVPPRIIMPLSILVFVGAGALWGQVAPPFNPRATHPQLQLIPPGSHGHLLGTDQYGRDVLSRLLAAAGTDLFVAVVITLGAFCVGTALGALCGFIGGWFDMVWMRLVDVVQAFPSFLLALAITSVIGNTLQNVVLAVAIAYVPYFVRLTRGEMLSARERDYAQNARAVGSPPWRVVVQHLLPNCVGPAVVQASLTGGWAILDVAGMSFLGLGITPPSAEWGADVALGTNNMLGGQWWTAVFPGLAITVTVLAFNFLGDGLRTIYSHGKGVE